MDLPTLAGILGQAKLNMVLRYAHPTPEQKRVAMTNLEKYVKGNRLKSHETESCIPGVGELKSDGAQKLMEIAGRRLQNLHG